MFLLKKRKVLLRKEEKVRENKKKEKVFLKNSKI
jgi:hypothetical protein